VITVGPSALQTCADGAQPPATMGKPPVLCYTVWYWDIFQLVAQKKEKSKEVLSYGLRASWFWICIGTSCLLECCLAWLWQDCLD